MAVVRLSEGGGLLLTKLKGLFEFETGELHHRGQVVEIALKELYAHKSRKP